MTPPTTPYGCLDLATGEIIEPRGVYVTYRCDAGHATRILDSVDYVDCDICADMLPQAPTHEYPCKHCNCELEDHADPQGKQSCLFMPTAFEPMDQLQHQRVSDEMWHAVPTYGRQRW